MKLPDRIPRRLRRLAVQLPELGATEGAWSKADALEVLRSLRGTTVAVSDVMLFERMPWGYAPSDSAWSADRLPNEGDADYAARSRSGALEFIERSTEAGDEALFALTFPMWKDAA